MHSSSTFDAIRNRQSARHFSSKKVSDQTLYELLDLANRAPSGFNLQPWHFILLRDPTLRGLVSHIAMGQPQIIEAPVTVVFAADPHSWRTSYPAILRASIDSEAMSEVYAERCGKEVEQFFSTGILGTFGVLKKLSIPLRRFVKPTVQAVTSRQEAAQYVSAQTMLAAGNFMMAASSVGLATCPMEGFDEERLKKLLAIPRHMSVPLIIPTGYAVEGDMPAPSLRHPLNEKLSIDLFPNTLHKLKPKKT